ncbi:uncharacterized protein BDZ99DRAFT_192971 [Mytilinidion resinicola]|uniref:Uncharacterized protein n=1 Tax=Mytilinidion resinicola TaxID=574789 RepID=A0A6A6Z2M4_9PEZI|nr:uncharacterized protein BDZ99DRAFT_192971 [Mytilinidion resinicola]KAF2815250.1 hypothetical protein BDZ99DRAFT_192971 [Mytilinidion resinicola]
MQFSVDAQERYILILHGHADDDAHDVPERWEFSLPSSPWRGTFGTISYGHPVPSFQSAYGVKGWGCIALYAILVLLEVRRRMRVLWIIYIGRTRGRASGYSTDIR